MDNQQQVRDFLASRRARISLEQAGLGMPRGHRRVSGLRRGEVADPASVSVEYYSRLERGNLRGASREVLDAVARALGVGEADALTCCPRLRVVLTGPVWSTVVPWRRPGADLR